MPNPRKYMFGLAGFQRGYVEYYGSKTVEIFLKLFLNLVLLVFTSVEPLPL